MADFEQQKRKLATGIKWGLGLIVAAIAAPIAVLALKSVVSVGLAILVVWGVGMLLTQILPAASFMISNAVLKVVKWESRRNPIETLQNQEVERRGELEQRLTKITDLETNVRTFKSKVKGLKERFPQDSADFDEQVSQLETILREQRTSFRQASETLDRFHLEIEKAQAKWDVAMSAQGAFKSAGRAAKNAMDQIKRETALDSVEVELSRAFAQLSSAVEQEVPQLGGQGRLVGLEGHGTGRLVQPVEDDAEIVEIERKEIKR